MVEVSAITGDRDREEEHRRAHDSQHRRIGRGPGERPHHVLGDDHGRREERPSAVERIAETSAPKKSACTARGVRSTMRRGKDELVVPGDERSTIAGSMSAALHTRKIGTSAMKKYTMPPATDPDDRGAFVASALDPLQDVLLRHRSRRRR
jgi:hypothetical protein